MIEGAVIALTSVLIGFVTGRAHRPTKQPKPIRPVCGCTHGIGYHKDKKAACSGVDRKHVGYTSGGNSKYEMVACTCQHYDGPTPVESYFSTPLITE